MFCLADWVLIEDLGFFGGLGTDPNSMIPFILLFTAGYLGLAPAAARAQATAGATEGDGDAQAAPEGASAPSGGRPAAARVPVLLRAFAGAPRAGHRRGRGARRDPRRCGTDGLRLRQQDRRPDHRARRSPVPAASPTRPAPDFTLTSQDGRQVSLASLRGKVVLLTFLDPVCTTDCPLIAQEMRSADTMLGAKASNTELVAVVANPTYISTAYTRAFTSQENLSQVPNWLFLTGSLSQLAAVWHHYGIEVEDLPAGAMAAHNDLAFVISADGKVQQEISDDPGPGTPATTSSFASLLADSVLQSMSKS